MHTDKVWIVFLLLFVILVGSNAIMFAMARGMRGNKTDWLSSLNHANRVWKKEDDGLKELNERVRSLQKDEEDKK